MTCSNCAKEYDYRLYCCPACGQINEPGEKKKNGVAIAGFVLSLIGILGPVLLVGFILDIVGYKKVIKLDGSGRKINKAGLIIACIKYGIVLIALVVVAILFATGVISMDTITSMIPM